MPAGSAPRRHRAPAGARRPAARAVWVCTRSRAVVVTHPHLDHVGGAPAVLRRLRVGEVLDPRAARRLARTSATSQDDGSRAPRPGRRRPRSGQVFRLGRLLVRVLWPDNGGVAGQNPHLHGVVLLASFGAVDILLTGDAESDVTSRLPLSPGRGAQGRPPRLGRSRAGRRAARPPTALRRDRGGSSQRLRAAEGGDRSRRCSASPGLTLYRTDENRRIVLETDGREHLGPAPAWSRLGVVSEQRELKPVYLITGSDEPKVELAVTQASRPFRGRGGRARLGARDVG